ncbi:MAG: hypoxanthine phosphoribosyltransferase [Deferribacterales bacterium]|nr:hypoxanthine phosphoribosyltransferase [Deferribacterales bacterium]
MRDKKTLEVMINEQSISEKVKEMAAEITKDYADKDLVAVIILKGSVIFASDLLRNVDLPLEMSFMAVSSYGDGTESSKKVNIRMDVDRPVEGRDVLIIEDIVDTGITLSNLKEYFLKEKNVKSFKICSLLDKPSRRLKDISPDYCGFSIDDHFVVGYGLDVANKYRNLKNICKIVL